ncbi:hypothetical protein [Chryseolinea soli]|uniref:HEAT repeat domain-containing protein n=1 Tax=Chryseolinea soli TaxID=2321403 RepID=A0A385SK27_9BACT|nr:hypothetical protein [Chryseolinea soli]AYB31314.1 hypothetical protein D4L85_12315 [Chryseolinea soli]
MKIAIFILCLFEVGCSMAQSATPSKSKYDPESAKIANMRRIGYLFLRDSLRPSDDEITFACMDSILSTHKGTRDYFFPVFEKIAMHADGALAEVIGSYALTYVKKYPQEFSARYSCCRKDEPCCQKLIRLATILGEETMMDNYKTKAYNELINDLTLNYKNWRKERVLSLLMRTVDATRKNWKD